jgi:hypothetical protein
MDQKTKSSLEGLFKEDQKRVVAATQAADLRKQQEAEFVASFTRVRDEVIRATLPP